MIKNRKGSLAGLLAILLWMALLTGTVCAQEYAEGMAAYQRGQFERAYEVFTFLFREDPGKEEVNFGLGMAAMSMGKFSHASFAFERVLMLNPNHHRARLELGRAYFAMGQYELAQEEFLQALSKDLPKEVEINVEKYLAKIDQLATAWHFMAEMSLSAFYDDNVNYGPASETIDTVVGVLDVVEQSFPTEAWGGAMSLGVGATYDLGKPGFWQLTSRANGYQNMLEDASDQEIRFGRGAMGVRRLGQATLLDLSARADVLDYGGESLLRLWGLDPSILVVLGDSWHLTTKINYEIRDYLNNDDRDSEYVRGGQSLRHFWGRRPHNITIEADVFQENAEEKPFENSGWESAGSVEFSLPWRLKLYGVARYRSIVYKEVLYPELQAESREDEQYQLVGGLRKKCPWNLELDLNFRHVKNESNFDLYDYERNVATVTSFVRF